MYPNIIAPGKLLWYDQLKLKISQFAKKFYVILLVIALSEDVAIKNLKKKGKKMKIDVKQENGIFVVELEGRMDTNTSPEFQKEMETYYSQEGFKMLLDFDKLDFVSSAGLRVLLLIQKKSKALKGSLVIKNVKPEIQEVFDMTGFSDILTIE